MKRFRPMFSGIDTRANVYQHEIDSCGSNEERSKAIRQQQKELSSEFGQHRIEQKYKNFMEIGILPVSIINEHNNLFYEVRNSYICEQYYPALVGACALGERILNSIVLTLRDHFKSSPHYKALYRKESFDNWDFLITVLGDWGILFGDQAVDFERIKDLRHWSVHYNQNLNQELHSCSREAILKLIGIISSLFTAFGASPYFIEGTKGACYIKKEMEEHPFVREFYVPASIYVGPRHSLLEVMVFPPKFEDIEYPDIEITDQQFCDLVNNKDLPIPFNSDRRS